MKRYLLLLIAVAVCAEGREIGYKPGSKLTLIFASGVECDVKVVERKAELVTVAPRKTRSGCPIVPSIVDLRTVVGISGRKSAFRQFLGAAIIIGGIAATPGVAFGTDSAAAFRLTLYGSIAGGAFVGQSGYKWTVYLNQSTIPEALK